MLEVEVTEEANDLSHGGGLMPSSYNTPTIYDAATTYLC